MDLEYFCATTFKWRYVRAQEELVGQMVAATKYFVCALYAEQVFSVIEHFKIDFRDLLCFCVFFEQNLRYRDPLVEIL